MILKIFRKITMSFDYFFPLLMIYKGQMPIHILILYFKISKKYEQNNHK